MIIDIVRFNFKIIIFGFIFTLFSSIGQSYFIGLFNVYIREDLGISHGDFGTLYAVATLCSGLILVWLGKKIDEVRLVTFSIFVAVFLSLSALFFSFVNTYYFLFIGIFFLRLSGQGLMSHTATTAIARFFDKRRGKALSIVWLGLSLAEFLLPIIIALLLSIFYWRTIWLGISIITFLFLPFFSLITVKKINILSREKSSKNKVNKFIKSWKVKEVLFDIKFYSMLPALLAPAALMTGIFVFQFFIAESKNWNIYVIPSSFMIYSVTSVASLFFAGFLVDKFTSAKIFPLLNVPLLLGSLILVYFDHQYSAFVLMFFMGVTNGFSNVLFSSIWAEVYGVKYLGSIRALATAIMVFSSALGTSVFGVLIDLGYTIEKISNFSGIYIAISIIIALIYRKKYRPILQNKT